MDGWMDGWMDGYMNGWMDEWMDGWMDGINKKNHIYNYGDTMEWKERDRSDSSPGQTVVDVLPRLGDTAREGRRGAEVGRGGGPDAWLVR